MFVSVLISFTGFSFYFYPGPGQYTLPNTLDRNKAFSFGIKVNKKIKNDVPPPNFYKTEKANLTFTPSYTFGSRYEQKVRNDTPGKYTFQVILNIDFFCFCYKIIFLFH